jgi:glycosyltransferase involved in cell wall biosynthesis
MSAPRTLETPAGTRPGAGGTLSIVVPCLNEEQTVGEFVDWCFEGLRKAGVEGEVIIVDSSDDRSPEIAAERGAKVVRVPKRGLGRAYIDAIPHISGDWVLMGDCDLTYDFREIAGFIAALDAGHEFVMGSRTKGSIEPGAMPALHRHFGAPATNWVFNRIYGTRFSDIHCGMRAMTLDALKQIDLQSQGWEYASEMILKASRLRLRSTEVPVIFYRDREGRESHLKRGGWRTPWIAGWHSLRVMFLNAPEFFLFWPGIVLLTVGFVLSAALAGGPFHAIGVGFNLHWMLFGVVATTLGYSALQLALLARVHHDFDPAFSRRLLARLTYNRGVAASALLIVGGLVPNAVLAVHWLDDGFRLSTIDHPAVFGLLLLIVGFQTFGFTLLLHILGHRREPD